MEVAEGVGVAEGRHDLDRLGGGGGDRADLRTSSREVCAGGEEEGGGGLVVAGGELELHRRSTEVDSSLKGRDVVSGAVGLRAELLRDDYVLVDELPPPAGDGDDDGPPIVGGDNVSGIVPVLSPSSISIGVVTLDGDLEWASGVREVPERGDAGHAVGAAIRVVKPGG